MSELNLPAAKALEQPGGQPGDDQRGRRRRFEYYPHPSGVNSHANQSTYVIQASWNRVKQVVDWSLDAGLTVMINTHWDGGWFDNNIGSSVNPTINAKVNSYWTQIADKFAGWGRTTVCVCLRK